jgi:hypothetical protein
MEAVRTHATHRYLQQESAVAHQRDPHLRLPRVPQQDARENRGPRYLERVMFKNRETSFGRSLHAPPLSRISVARNCEHRTPTGATRHSAYVAIAGSHIDRPDLFEPASYLFADNLISPKCPFIVTVPSATQPPSQTLKHNICLHAPAPGH